MKWIDSIGRLFIWTDTPLARTTFISQHITPFNFWIIRFRSLNASNFFSPVILHVHELLVSVFSRWLGYDGTFPSRLSGPLSFIIVITHGSVVMFVVFLNVSDS